MSFCPNCGKTVPENSNYCPFCAASLKGPPNIAGTSPGTYAGVQPPLDSSGSLAGGIAIGFVLLVFLGWIPIIGALGAGFVAGLIARGVGRGAAAGFIAGVVGGIIAVFVLGALGSILGSSFGMGLLGGAIGAGIGGLVLLLSVGGAIFAAIGGAVGGAISHR